MKAPGTGEYPGEETALRGVEEMKTANKQGKESVLRHALEKKKLKRIRNKEGGIQSTEGKKKNGGVVVEEIKHQRLAGSQARKKGELLRDQSVRGQPKFARRGKARTPRAYESEQDIPVTGAGNRVYQL